MGANWRTTVIGILRAAVDRIAVDDISGEFNVIIL